MALHSEGREETGFREKAGGGTATRDAENRKIIWQF